VLRLTRASAGAPFKSAQSLTRTPYAESRLVANPSGALVVSWRNASGQLVAGTGDVRRGVRHRQQITHGRIRYRGGIDSHSSAIAANGRAVVAWRQRSLRPGATVRIRLSDAHGRFSKHQSVFRAPGATGVNAAINARGAASAAWNHPRRGKNGLIDQLVSTTRVSGRRFRSPHKVVRGNVEPVGLLASGNKLLLTWVTQPDLDAVSSVGSLHRH
jgi:hypothetical protein